MKLQDLRRTHRDYDPATIELHEDLFAGGAQFRRRIGRYLPKHDVEPDAVYARRKAQAHYLNYCAPIANYFASLLVGCPLQIAASEADPDFYATLKEDCDDEGADLNAFARARLTDALVAQRSWVRVEFPAGTGAPVESAADFEAAGLGRARLVAVPAKSIVHWSRDGAGALRWVIEYTRHEELVEWTDAEPTVTETWTQWMRDGSARRWQAAYTPARPPLPTDDVREVEPPHNPTGAIPLVCLELPPELWLLNHLADAQLELFRKRNALSWSIDRTCYAMAVLKTAAKKPPAVLGAGYYLQLGPNDSLEWPAPPSTPFETIGAYVATLKDEIHRVATQMAQGVENNAAAVGRSGDSKAQDAQATVVVLRAYGALVAEMVERVLCLVAAGRGERGACFDVKGMDRYESDDPGLRADQAVALEELDIPSDTLAREVLTRFALSAIADADEATKATVRAEIAAGLESRAKAAEAAKAAPPADDADAPDPEATVTTPAPPPRRPPARSPSSTRGTSRPGA